MATFTETIVTTAPSSPTVYAKVKLADGTIVVARAAMTIFDTVGNDSIWILNVTWDTTWANPIVVFDDGILPWSSKPVIANVTRIEGAAITQVDPVGRNLARVANRQYGTRDIYKGDTYSSSTGELLEFDRAATTDWPTITDAGWTCELRLTKQTNNTNDGDASATITTDSIVDDNNVDVSLTGAESIDLAKGGYDYWLVAIHATHGEKVLESGVITVKPKAAS